MQHFQLYDGLKGIRFHQTILWWLLILPRWIHLLHRCCYYFCNESGLPAKQSQIQKLTAKFSMDRCIISSQCGKIVTPIPRHRSPTTPMAAMQTYTKHLPQFLLLHHLKISITKQGHYFRQSDWFAWPRKLIGMLKITIPRERVWGNSTCGLLCN